MNILFVCHNQLSSNSGIHVSNLAHQMGALGVDAVAAVPDGVEADVPQGYQYRSTTFSRASDLRFKDGRGADLIHAWTPRQHVAKATRKLVGSHGCPYVVHLEDNELAITAAYLGLRITELEQKLAAGSDLAVPGFLTDPRDLPTFLAGSVGVTTVIDRLLEFKPAHVPGLEIWPAAEDHLFHPDVEPSSLRDELGISPKTKVLVYNGNVHPANLNEVRSLYLAVGALARRNVDIVLVRLGQGSAVPDGLDTIRRHVISVPFQPRERVAAYLALADVLVQPGRVDEFNAYRFPSKLSEFFAMGRPVILPATNIGLKIKDGKEAVLVHRGDVIELAEKMLDVFGNDDLSARLAKEGRRFYERMLSWKRSGRKLVDFYGQLNL